MNATKLSTRDIDQHRDDIVELPCEQADDGKFIIRDGEMLKRFIRTFA